MLHMLDTDIVSYILKGRSPALESKLKELQPQKVCVSAVTCAEVLYGLQRLPPENRLHAAVPRFFALIRVLAWDERAAQWYAGIRHQLTASGQPIGERDMMIAAHTLAAGAALVTNNARHFRRIKAPLSLVSWSLE